MKYCLVTVLTRTLIVSILILVCSFSCFFVVSGQGSSYMHVTIYGDGNYSFEPSNAPVQVLGNVFTLTGDVDSIFFIGGGVVLDGNGYTVTGENSSTVAVAISASNVIVKNLFVGNGTTVGISVAGLNNTVTNCTITGITIQDPDPAQYGAIFIFGGGNHRIMGNQIKENSVGIVAFYGSNNNVFFGNYLLGNVYGISLQDCSNNILYSNVFVNLHNWYSVSDDSVNYWDNGAVGNLWSNYNGTDGNEDGIGDTALVINQNNQDRYPLMVLPDVEEIPEFSLWMVLSLFLGGTLFALFFKTKRNLSNLGD